jgi:hypothetical protein
MAGLDPAICLFLATDPRVKPGDDDEWVIDPKWIVL